MKFRVVSLSVFACLAGLAGAEGTITVSGTAGSVAGKGSSGTWIGLAGSAKTATIGYTAEGALTGGTSGTGHEDKFGKPTPSTVAGRVFDGAAKDTTNGSIVIQGQSAVSRGTTTYYTAGFTARTTRFDTATGPASAGTYDPWDIHYSDVLSLGAAGSSVDLYYQSGLQAQGAGGAATGFTGFSGSSHGNYDFTLSISAGATTTTLLDILIDSNGTRTYTIGNNPNIQLYLLNGSASDPNATPSDRLLGRPPVTAANLDAYFSAHTGTNPGGSLLSDLNVGLLYSGFIVPTAGNPDDKLFSWHTDIVEVAPVPEPASIATLTLGGLCVLRRRRR